MEIRLSQPYSFCRLGRRTTQEDARFPDEDIPRGGGAVFLVCDGVGGIDCGEVASHVIADSVGNSLGRYDLSKPFGVSDFGKVLKDAVEKLTVASRHIKKDMATTLAFLCFHSEGAFMAHIGDSRIYHIRPGVGVLHQTSDHSLVNALVHSGNITPEEAIDHPRKNVITRCIRPIGNGEPAVASTLQVSDVEKGDFFFLCSDGVSHCIDDVGLLELVSDKADDETKIRKIEDLCRYSPDNNTAILIRVSDVVYDADEASKKSLSDSYVLSECVGHSSLTRPLNSLNEEIIETRDERKKSLGSRISDFFIRLFN